MNPPATPVLTAIETHADRNDLRFTQPLVEFKFDNEPLNSKGRTRQEDTGEDDEDETADAAHNALHCKALLIGALTGCSVHAVALTACALMGTHYGYTMSSSRFVFDLMVYILIWLAFATLTYSGMQLIRNKFQKDVERRYVYVIGVYFLMGVVLGTFVTWGVFACYLGFMVPILQVALAVSIDSVLFMTWCCDDGSAVPVEDHAEDTKNGWKSC